MALLLLLVAMLLLAGYGGVAVSPLFWIAVVVILGAIVLGPVGGRRW